MPRPFIYGLLDKNGELRYIGKANDPAKRLKSHMREVKRRHTPLYNWLRKHGAPRLVILEADCADWQEAECRWIAQARERGEKLLNLADGGDQPSMTTEQRRNNALALNARLAADPRMKRLRENKARLAYSLKRGTVSEATRAKMRLLAERCPAMFSEWSNV